MINVLIFPVHLFSVKLFPKKWKDNKTNITFHLLEDPIYWGTDPELKLNMNQMKLVLHRATMRYYVDYLKKNGYKKINYVEEEELNKSKSKYSEFITANPSSIEMFDPVDRIISKKVSSNLSKHEIVIYDNPGFLLTGEACEKYKASISGNKSKSKRYSHANFYSWVKDHLDLTKLLGKKSYDNENREPMPSSVEVPSIPSLAKSKINQTYVKDAVRYIKTNYPNNYGDGEEFYLPVTHTECQKWFKNFLTKRFSKFGKYQDAISQKEPWVFHSVIAPMVNVGTLDMGWVLAETVKYYNKHKSGSATSKIDINSCEGFIRQIVGWREYSRYLYMYEDYGKSNHFNHKRKLTAGWYKGTLGIKPVDWAINGAFKYGYLHHIGRLMIMANFMNLCELDPDEVFKWFMEFSMDSYQWVMYNNIYGMGTYADGGLTMSKPYLSSSNYILKMSDFVKDKHWEVIWTDLFYRFLYKHETKLKGTPYLRNLAYYKSLSDGDKRALLKRADDFIKEHTK
jgi:deoxyribodipyrimidine photolyase-related protein